MRAYYATHSEPVKARNKAWRDANPERVRAIDRRKVQANPDVYRRIAKRYKAANRDKRNTYLREWTKANPEKRRAKEERRRARHAAAMVSGVMVSADSIASRFAMFAGCWICGGPKTEMDHVKPLAVGGLHVPANIRPACKPCNSSKGDTWPFTGHPI
ncbi:MAG: HNH endonuclease signature motif containing protein [Alphaproteobacteria bacterium]